MLRSAIEETTHHRKIGGNVMRFGTIACLYLLLGLVASAQDERPHARLSEAEFVSLVRSCAPGAPADSCEQ